MKFAKLDFGRHEIDGSTLRCPLCQGECLHQGMPRIFARGEDQPVTLIEFGPDRTPIVETMPSHVSGNPSTRRQGLAIPFECELCDAAKRGLELVIYQHKGETFMAWRYE